MIANIFQTAVITITATHCLQIVKYFGLIYVCVSTEQNLPKLCRVCPRSEK